VFFFLFETVCVDINAVQYLPPHYFSCE